MKDYEHVVIWLDYFNKTLPRAKGRRLEKEKCIFDPSLKELTEAAQAAGFEITETEEKVRYPRRPYVRSGYIVLPKGSSKTNILNKISQKLLLKRTKPSKKI
jgi:signal recognition particle subunit SRP19